jgi:hypothetical protein
MQVMALTAQFALRTDCQVQQVLPAHRCHAAYAATQSPETLSSSCALYCNGRVDGARADCAPGLRADAWVITGSHEGDLAALLTTDHIKGERVTEPAHSV